MRYQHLFFDLDHTLWDHHRNANETLEDLYKHYELVKFQSFSPSDLINAFHKVNHDLWDNYNHGRIDQSFIRKRRFPMVLEALGIKENDVPNGLAEEYLQQCPQKPHLMPHTIEVLDYLQTQYDMSIITNGFSDVQDIKMASSGLHRYFHTVITSEDAGSLKPDPVIFDFAIQSMNLSKETCLMIGDNPSTDIAGAQAAGIDQIYYDPNNLKRASSPTYRVQSLQELCELL